MAFPAEGAGQEVALARQTPKLSSVDNSLLYELILEYRDK